MQNRSQHHFNLWFVLKIDPFDGWQLIYAIINSSIFHWVDPRWRAAKWADLLQFQHQETVTVFSHVGRRKNLWRSDKWTGRKNLEKLVHQLKSCKICKKICTDLWTWQYNINCPCCPCWNCVSKNVAMEGNAKNPDSPVGRFSRLAACTTLAVNEQLVKHWKEDNFQMCGWHLKMKDITMNYGL